MMMMMMMMIKVTKLMIMMMMIMVVVVVVEVMMIELTKLIEWNGYETRETPLLYVFVDLTVHNVQ